MKWDFKMTVLIMEWSSFWGGHKAGFYCILMFLDGLIRHVHYTHCMQHSRCMSLQMVI